uniref:Uncharacterized protein n=1 Tax=Picea sitchensis TaxID=3332 RepID=A9NVP9_PICSI|nr:unknown [Picea sitchensis]
MRFWRDLRVFRAGCGVFSCQCHAESLAANANDYGVFSYKYNYDPVNDLSLAGQYE